MDQFNFNNFPETNFNEVNLSWMLEVMTQFKEDSESGQFVGPQGPQGPQGEPGPAGDGITEEVKQALLQLARKVAYIDDQGQTYYQDLYNALYGVTPAELVSISAVYTQAGAVYDTDSLDSLKSNLIVTATYSDSSTAVIPSTDYTLSGTLTEGTSTITVSYQGKMATFNVTVTEYVDTRTLLYNWDLTSSLTDTVSEKVATLTGATQDATGVHLTGLNNHADFAGVLSSGSDCTVEVDVSSFDRQGTEHGRFIMLNGTMGFIYRKTGSWSLYLGTSWVDSQISDTTYFNGKTVVLKFVWSGTSSFTLSVWCDSVKIVESTYTTASNIMLGSSQSNTAYNSTFTALRVYEGV